MSTEAYELVDGDLHRHGMGTHAHPHRGPHSHDSAEAPRFDRPTSEPQTREHGEHDHDHDHHEDAHDVDEHCHDDHAHGTHGHSHGLIDESIKRSRAGVRAVLYRLRCSVRRRSRRP